MNATASATAQDSIPMANAIANSFGNPARLLRLADWALQLPPPEQPGVVRITQLTGLETAINAAQQILDSATRSLHDRGFGDRASAERTRARTVIDSLREWIHANYVATGFPGGQPTTLQANLHVRGLAGELADLGHQLAMSWHDAQVASPWAEPTLDERGEIVAVASRLDSIPALDESSGDWISVKQTAREESIGTNTLRNYRRQGTRSVTADCGIDAFGRQWRKPSANAHVKYYRPSLNSSATKNRHQNRHRIGARASHDGSPSVR